MVLEKSQLSIEVKDLNSEIKDKIVPDFTWYLYVLLLENDFYYIGITLYPHDRILSHFKGLGANFTKRNTPMKLIELYSLNIIERKLAYKQENLKTKEYRNLYGAHKVIGGKYLSLKKIITQ
jgi:predicted GIY-YIG superfamily endonuclease